MNLLSSFNDFYSDLSSNGLFFFWIVVFLFVFLIFLLLVLYNKNKKLVNLMKQNIMEDKEDDSIIKDEELLIPEEKTNEEQKAIEMSEPVKLIEESEQIKLIEETEQIKEIEAPKEVKLIEETGPYKKNVLREMNTRMQTSPINIVKEKEEEKNKENDIDLTGIDYGEDSVSPLEMMEDNYEVNDNMKLASEIVSKMEQEIKPSNIELTEYEKKQEEEAIISYDELLKVKDKIYNITEDEETDEFIDELKNFRIDLK